MEHIKNLTSEFLQQLLMKLEILEREAKARAIWQLIEEEAEVLVESRLSKKGKEIGGL